MNFRVTVEAEVPDEPDADGPWVDSCRCEIQKGNDVCINLFGREQFRSADTLKEPLDSLKKDLERSVWKAADRLWLSGLAEGEGKNPWDKLFALHNSRTVDVKQKVTANVFGSAITEVNGKKKTDEMLREILQHLDYCTSAVPPKTFKGVDAETRDLWVQFINSTEATKLKNDLEEDNILVLDLQEPARRFRNIFEEKFDQGELFGVFHYLEPVCGERDHFKVLIASCPAKYDRNLDVWRC